jgi:RNA-binding protein YhbY
VNASYRKLGLIKLSIMSLTIEERLTRLEKIIQNMTPKVEQWVGPTLITKKTGWNKRDMERCRRNGSIKFKRSSTGGYRYLLSSIIL